MIEEIAKLLLAERQEGLLLFGSLNDKGYWMAEHAHALMTIAAFHRVQREWRGPAKSRVITMVLGPELGCDVARRVRGMMFDCVWATGLARDRMNRDDWSAVMSRLRPR
jgi:hypothetical protein